MEHELLQLHAHDRKGKRWTAEDDALLSRYAGKVSLDQVAGMLHRTTDSVRKRAELLGIDHRCPKPTLMICPRCGEWRTRLEDGICMVCHKQDTRDALEQRERGLLDMVSDAYRERAMSRRQAEPRRPRRKGLGPVEVERVLCAQLDKENSTRRRRCERMEQWLRSRYVDTV